MEKELLRHIEILKTVPEIKKDLDKKLFVSSLTAKEWNAVINQLQSFDYWECKNKEEAIWKQIKGLRSNIKYKDYSIFIEVCLGFDCDIEERHLRMFCEEKWYWMIINCQWWITVLNSIYFELDNSKPYMEQSEEFFKKLNDWIVKEFNIKLK